MPGKILAASLALWCLAAFPAFAHVGQGHTEGFAHGFVHPLTGLDHVIAMAAAGLYAAILGGRRLWLVPMAFIACMISGGSLGYGGIPFPQVEEGIGASVVVLSLAVALGFELPAVAAMMLVGVFAVFHGHAHGSEGAELSSFLPYAAGFSAATALLHLTGIGLGIGLSRLKKAPSLALRRSAGAAGALAGVAILGGWL
ncbi:MAG TPA: HupE/UreJ family protein [Methylocella sp.]|nr:HupE/UreJ family protein [Methylocella sp.]